RRHPLALASVDAAIERLRGSDRLRLDRGAMTMNRPERTDEADLVLKALVAEHDEVGHASRGRLREAVRPWDASHRERNIRRRRRVWSCNLARNLVARPGRCPELSHRAEGAYAVVSR